MLGAIAGDIIGSVYEYVGNKTTDFLLFHPNCDFTDDTVLTVAVADWILNGGDLVAYLHRYANRYPNAGYGGRFLRWVQLGSREPYHSWGNGSAMRVSPVGFAFDSLEQVLEESAKSAAVTHNHPEGIKGAQATAAAVFLARAKLSKDAIRSFVQDRFQYDLNRSLETVRATHRWNESCQECVPESLIAFFESEDFETAIRNAVSIGGDADTMACIAGGIAQAYYGGVPEPIKHKALESLDPPLRWVVEEFNERFSCP